MSPFEVTSPWATRNDKALEREGSHAKSFSWYSFPDTNLVVPLTFIVQDTQKIAQSVEVVYDRLAYPIRFEREFTNFITRTTVTQQDTFSAAATRGLQ
jgi:hypothetical protein